MFTPLAPKSLIRERWLLGMLNFKLVLQSAHKLILGSFSTASEMIHEIFPFRL